MNSSNPMFWAKFVAILEFVDQFINAPGLFAEEGSNGYTKIMFRNAYSPKF